MVVMVMVLVVVVVTAAVMMVVVAVLRVMMVVVGEEDTCLPEPPTPTRSRFPRGVPRTREMRMRWDRASSNRMRCIWVLLCSSLYLGFINIHPVRIFPHTQKNG